MCPHGAITEATVLGWKHEILEDAKIKGKIAELGRWNYDHCRDNTFSTKRKKQIRGSLQADIVEVYRSHICALGGRIIIFDNPKGLYNADNTTNFLTVLAKGLMMLFFEIQETTTSINLYFASRRNNTQKDHPEQISISPTRVQTPGLKDDGVILPVQYRSQIRNLAFLQGGQWLLENKVFSEMISNIKIIDDLHVNLDANGHYEKKSNPLTVPCDYICNTYITADGLSMEHQQRVSEIYHSEGVLVYRTDRPVQVGITGLPSWKDDQNNGTELLSLMSMDFPEPATSKFFKSFNDATEETQRTIINYIVRALYEKVDNQKAMPLMCARLEHSIDEAENIKNKSIRNEFVANLQLYLKSLYTHLGMQNMVIEITDRFKNVLNEIEDDSIRDELIDIADNRHLVDLTDSFNYEIASREFSTIETFWKTNIATRQKRLPSDSATPKYPTYGKTIGSFLQILRHMIHSSTGEDRELYYIEAQELYGPGRDHLIKDVDISRFHQTCCDIESEMQNYAQAFKHLYYAANIFDDPDVEKNEDIALDEVTAKSILSKAGFDGQKNPYLLQHYVRLLATYYNSPVDDINVEQFVAPLLPYISVDFGSLINTPHPKTQIQWKTASFLANRRISTEGERRISNKLFDTAAKNLISYETPIFAAIAAGVRAEQFYHILKHNIPGNQLVVRKAMSASYQLFVETKPESMLNPFEPLLEDENKEMTPEKLSAIARIIGY